MTTGQATVLGPIVVSQSLFWVNRESNVCCLDISNQRTRKQAILLDAKDPLKAFLGVIFAPSKHDGPLEPFERPIKGGKKMKKY